MIQSKPTRQKNAGFTLIDAMIAVVVLATGILALTLLQTTMLRATAEARDRSEAATVAQNLVEQLRAHAAATPADYQALDVAGAWSGGDCDFATTTLTVANFTGTSADTDYRYCLDVTRYLDVGGAFTEVAVSGGPGYSNTTSEFKQVEIQIGWKKQDGSWGRLTLGDAISGIPLANSKELENRSLGGGVVLGDAAKVQYPSSYLEDEDNFIPIAVGDATGTQIAATNPTPEVIGAGVAETSYQVYTYLSQTGAIEVQRQIDTKVVACTCTLQQASSDPTSFLDFSLRPSYWNGRRYTAPELVDAQETYLRGVPAGGSNESEFCDICCRDHHDPSGLDYNGEDNTDPADDMPKVDPFTGHAHYADATAPAAAAAGQGYDEVCRLVRVDGVYRVTPDPSIEHFSLIPTDNGTRDRTTESITSGYNGFVRDYIEDRLLPIAQYDATDSLPEALVPPVDVATLEDANGLNAQAAADIVVSDQETTPIRYLQNRAVILDALEYPARKTIETQLASDASCASDPLPCILAFVPFASINLTMLAAWNAEPEGIFTVNPQDVVDPNDGTIDAYAGEVGLEASPTGTGTDSDIVTRLSRTVAALVDRYELFPTTDADRETWRHDDSQGFERTNSSPTGASFTIVPAGLAYLDPNSEFFGAGDAPDVRWVSGTSSGVCVFSQADKDFTCHVFDPLLLSDMDLRINNYHGNLEVDTKGNDADGIECPSTANKPDAPPAKCAIYASSLANVSPAPTAFTLTNGGNASPADDTITIELGAVADGNSYTVTFTGGTATTPGGTCNETTGVVTWEWNACRID